MSTGATLPAHYWCTGGQSQGRPADLGRSEPLSQLLGVNPVRSAGEGQQRLAGGVEDHTVRDRALLTVKRCSRRDGGGSWLGASPQFGIDTNHAQDGRHVADSGG